MKKEMQLCNVVTMPPRRVHVVPNHLTHVTHVVCASYVLCQAQVSSQVSFLGFRILCHRNDWLPVDHPCVLMFHDCGELV